MNDFEKLLRDAARDAETTMVSDFEAGNTEHNFSPAFETKMTLLRSNRSAAFTRFLKSAACFALVLLMGCTLYLGTDAAARERFIGWLKNVESPTSVHYYFDGVDDTAPVRYEMTKIPEGYTFVVEYETGRDDYMQIYRNANGKQFAFSVAQSDGGNVFIQTDGAPIKYVDVNGITAEFYYGELSGDSNTIVWIDETTKTMFLIDGFFSEQELVDFAESVSPVLSLSIN